MKLPAAELARLQGMAERFVARSPVLAALVAKVEVQRGRFYIVAADKHVMARITPLTDAMFLLEAPWRNGWSEAKRGSWRVVLNALERDRLGTFHGLGTLASKKTGDGGSVQQKLRGLGIPVAVLAEPRDWYARHRTPAIRETSADRHRVLVRFEAFGMSGSFHDTFLYARLDGAWGCYTVKPAASGSIASAEAWLIGRSWQDWGIPGYPGVRGTAVR